MTRRPSQESFEPTASPPKEPPEPTPAIARGTRDDLAAKARAARAEIRDDVAAIAHDLKNPLAVIMLETNVLEQRLATRVTPAILRGLERISQNAAYVDRLVSDLLDLASADAGVLELRLERCDLAQLLARAIERTVPTMERNGVRLDVRNVLHASADPLRIERVVANLITNALKHGLPPVTVRLDARGTHACISVIDGGPGLTAEQARLAFDRHQRERADGHGLGLHICRRIVEAHRGRVGVQSTPGKSSRFFFELPVIA